MSLEAEKLFQNQPSWLVGQVWRKFFALFCWRSSSLMFLFRISDTKNCRRRVSRHKKDFAAAVCHSMDWSENLSGISHQVWTENHRWQVERERESERERERQRERDRERAKINVDFQLKKEKKYKSMKTSLKRDKILFLELALPPCHDHRPRVWEETNTLESVSVNWEDSLDHIS